jgi:plasmid maintenance system killer protein
VDIEIKWADRRLEKSCATDKAGQRRWGADGWKLLQRRLASLAAAPTLKDMYGLPGHCHPLGADRPGQFAISLWGAARLVFVPNHDPVPRLDDGGIDTRLVTKILITEVVDYHGD